jgi:hypothetical protein
MSLEEPTKQRTEVYVKIDSSIIHIVWQEVKYFAVGWVICGTLKLCWFFIMQFVLIVQMVCVFELYV